MIFYLLLAVPGLLIFMTMNYARYVYLNRILLSYGKGILAFFPSYLILFLIKGIIDVSYDSGTLYLEICFENFLFPLILAGLFFYLLDRKILEEPVAVQALGIISFLCGFYTLIAVTDILFLRSVYDAYILFYLPTLRIGIILGMSLYAIGGLSAFGYKKFFYAALGITQIFLYSLVPFLWEINFHAISFLLSLIFTAATFMGVFFLSRRFIS